MTGLEGNRQIYLPRKIQGRLPKSFYWEAILNLNGQIDSLLPEGPVIYLFYYTIMLLKEKNDFFNWKLISSTMGLITKKHIRLNDHNLFLRIIIMKNNKKLNSNST